MSRPYGIVLGRFQPIHLGHIEYLQAAKMRCERLFIGITNPDTEEPRIAEADPQRSQSENNPFKYIDRHLMIEAALLDQGWAPSEFCIMAGPITQPARLASYLPSPAVAAFFVTIYDEWGEQKAKELDALGYEVSTLWRRSHDQRLTSGSWIRAAMRRGEAWHAVVPAAVAAYIESNGLDRMVKESVK